MRRDVVRCAVILENGGNGWGASVSDLPGCVATGTSADEVAERIRGAIGMHVEGLAEEGESPPSPTTAVESVEVATPAAAPR